MSIVRYKLPLDELPQLSEETRVRLAARTDEEIEAAALADPNNPPLTDEQLDRMAFRRDLRMARQALGVDLDGLAQVLRLPTETVQAWAQPGAAPDPAGQTLLRLVVRDPQAIVRLLAA